MCPRNAGRSTSPMRSVGARARFGELAGDPPDLDHRDTHRVRHHDRHLQDDAQLLPDVVCGELLEALGTIAGLEQERIAGSNLGERRLEGAGFAGEHQRRVAGERLEGPEQLIAVGPRRLLPGGPVLPRRRRPGQGHVASLQTTSLTTWSSWVSAASATGGGKNDDRRRSGAPSASTWASTSSGVPIAPSSIHQSSGAWRPRRPRGGRRGRAARRGTAPTGGRSCHRWRASRR